MVWMCDVLYQGMHPCGLALLHHQRIGFVLVMMPTGTMPTVVMPEGCLLAGAWLPVTS